MNNRKILNGLPKVAGFDPALLVEVIRVIDKVDKVVIDKVIAELTRNTEQSGVGLSHPAGEAVRKFMTSEGDFEALLTQVESLCDGQGIMAEGVDELRQVAE